MSKVEVEYTEEFSLWLKKRLMSFPVEALLKMEFPVLGMQRLLSIDELSGGFSSKCVEVVNIAYSNRKLQELVDYLSTKRANPDLSMNRQELLIAYLTKLFNVKEMKVIGNVLSVDTISLVGIEEYEFCPLAYAEYLVDICQKRDILERGNETRNLMKIMLEMRPNLKLDIKGE